MVPTLDGNRLPSCLPNFSMIDYYVKSHNSKIIIRRPGVCDQIQCSISCSVEPYCSPAIKVAEDDIAFKLAIFKKSLHLNDNTGFCSIIQASKLVFGSLLAKNNFFVQFWTKNFASSRMANCGSGLPAEWPFRSQNAIEASDIRHCPVACG